MLAPSERSHKNNGLRHKRIIDWTKQLVLVGDTIYLALELSHACQTLPRSVTLITRLRLDGALYTLTPKRSNLGRPRLKGKRLPTLAQRLRNARTKWHKVCPDRNGRPKRRIDFATGTAVWYRSGKPPVRIRGVAPS